MKGYHAKSHHSGLIELNKSEHKTRTRDAQQHKECFQSCNQTIHFLLSVH